MAQFEFDAHASGPELRRNSRVDVDWQISGNTVRLIATGLPLHSYGNPLALHPATVQNFDVAFVYRGGQNAKAGRHEAVGPGPQGWWLNGVAVLSPSAGNIAPANFTPVKGYTFNTAYTADISLGYTFNRDSAGGIVTPGGIYHYNDFRFATAWTTGTGSQVGQAGLAEASVITYLSNSLTHANGHSRILGWALDGYPIYGPFGYANPLDDSSGIRRMVSGYAMKSAAYRTGTATNLTTYPMGIFTEDFEWGNNGDLDRHNGRYCRTPDFPTGTYAYFVTVDGAGAPVYPYVLGNTFYGTPTKLTALRAQAPIPAPPGTPVSGEAATIAIQVVQVAKAASEEEPRIRWVTPRGSLGVYAENSELSIQLQAENPLVDSVLAAGFDPRLVIPGNGNGTMTVTMPSTKHRLDISYRPGLIGDKQFPDPVGQVIVGAFPNALNTYPLQAREYTLEYPYRGGRNEAARIPTAVRDQQIGISAVGIPFYGPVAARVEGEENSLWNVNGILANINGRDTYGGYTDRTGTYRYQDSRFITNNAWSKIRSYQTGYRHPDGHSRIIGWAADGFPIYGPYGYVNPRDVGEVRLMVSGYRLATVSRNRPQQDTAVVVRGSKRSNRVTLDSRDRIRPGMRIDAGGFPPGAVWVVGVFNNDIILNRVVNIEAGEVLRGYWPPGIFLEDWRYVGQGTLDQHNGRFCVTPEFPGGTYAYFATQNDNGEPVFPYIIGNSFKGELTISDPPVPGIADLSGAKAAQALTWTVVSGELPPGTQLYRSTGLIYGHPIVLDAKSNLPRSYAFTVRASNARGMIADRAFNIDINNVAPPVLVDAADPLTNIVNLGTYFDSEPIEVPLEYADTTPGQTLQWSVSRGAIPFGLELDQNGVISGFALAPRAAGAAGTGAYDQGKYDQFVYDYEGATLTRTYRFTIRLYDGVNFAEKKYQMTILAKSFFRADNALLTADADDTYDLQGIVSDFTIFRADKDGFVYPTVLTEAEDLPAVKQDRAFAFRFNAYFPNPNFPIKWEITNSPRDEFGETPFDSVNYDSATLALPQGLTLDETTGWLTGYIPVISETPFEGRQFYDFQVRAYVDVPIDRNITDRRYSQPIQYRLNVLSAAENLITFTTPADLGTIDNGRISTLKIEAEAVDGQPLTYQLKSTMRELIAADSSDQRIVSGAASRLPQGLKLLPSGLISGRTTFDFFSMDRYEQAEIKLDRNSTTIDAVFTFVVQAVTEDGVSFGNQTFTLRVRNINRRPFESLYMRSLAPLDVRRVFHSVLDDVDLDDIIYRPDDPYFGIPKTLSFLAVPGLKADTPAAYMLAMAKNHINKEINFGELKTAVATDANLRPKYEVLYVEVKEPGNPLQSSDAINRVYVDQAAISRTLTIESNTFENMKAAMVDSIGYEFQGALPEWMINLQPDTRRPLGFIRAVVLGYANPGESQRLKVAFSRSLVRGSFGFSTMFGQFKFVADRYQWDRALSINYNPVSKKFVASRETTFDVSAPIFSTERGPWIPRTTGVSPDINGIGYDGETFVAVGDNNTLITSRRGEIWQGVSATVDLTYSSALAEPVQAGNNYVIVNTGVKYSVGDEVLQRLPWNSEDLAYITQVNYIATVSLPGTSNVSPVTATVPAGTTIEFVDSFGTLKETTLISQAEIGVRQLDISSVDNLTAGDTFRIKGLDQRIITNISAISGNTIILGDATTNVIASGTTVILDDQIGNVFVLQTDGITPEGNLEILTTQDLSLLSNLSINTVEYLPSIGGLNGQLLGVRANLALAGSSRFNIQKDADLQFSSRIYQNSPAGSFTIYLSNTDRVAVKSQVTSEAFTAATFSTGSWNSNVSAATGNIRMVLPTETISGTIITNMTVIGPTLPADTRVTRVTTEGALTYIDATFAPVTGIFARGIKVTSNGYYSLTVSEPLDYELEIGSLLTFDDYTGTPQTLTAETRTSAGANVILFNTAPGRSMVGYSSRVQGFGAESATLISSGEFFANGVTIDGNIQFNIPAGVTVNFQDSQGNTQYVLSQPAEAFSSNLLFTSNIITDITGLSAELLSITAGTTVIEIDTESNVMLLSIPTVGPLPTGSNIGIQLDGNITYVYANADVATGQIIVPITTVPESQFVGNLVNTNGLQVGTLISDYVAGNLSLDLAANATIVANSVIRLTTASGFANISVTVQDEVTQEDTFINITTTPAGNLLLSNLTLLGINPSATVSTTTANTVVYSLPTTHALPQGTTIRFFDELGHSANLVTATAFGANVSSILLTEPAVISLVGHDVPLNGNAILSFSSTSVVEPGTTVIEKTQNTLTISRPLLANLDIGFDDSLTFGVASADFNQIRYINERWVAVGSRASVVSQDDLGNWDLRTAYPYGDLFSVAYGNDTYVAVGSGGLILSSTDLETWTPQASSTGEDLLGVWYYGGLFLIVGNGGFVQSSQDGLTWTDISFTVWSDNPQRSLRTIKHLGGQWIAVGEGGTILLSTDAVNWSIRNSGSKNTLTDVNYSQGQYFAIGFRGAVFESQDGESWNERLPGVSNNLLSIATDGFNQLIAGESGLVLSSSGAYVVDFAVRGISFEMFNNNSIEQLAARGYRVIDGQTLIFAQQEGFPEDQFRGPRFENDGWNNYEVVFDNTDYDEAAFEISAITTAVRDNVTGANVSISSIEGVQVGDLITTGPYTVDSGIQVDAIWDLERLITTSAPIALTAGDVVAFVKPVGFDTKTVVAGYFENQRDPNVINRRAGIWQVNVDNNNLVKLRFVRSVNLGQSVLVRNENVKLVYDINVAGNRTVPSYTILREELELPRRTTFDGSGTRFSSNRDTYTEPNTLDKFIKFPRTGVFE